MVNKEPRTDIKDYLPSVYDGNHEMTVLAEIYNHMFDQLEEDFQKISRNQWIITSDTDGLAIYEELIGLINRESVDDMEFRRSRLLNRLSMVTPFTAVSVTDRLDALAQQGDFGYFWRIVAEESRVYLSTQEIMAYDKMEEVYYTLQQMLPANIEVIYDNKITVTSATVTYTGAAIRSFKHVEITFD